MEGNPSSVQSSKQNSCTIGTRREQRHHTNNKHEILPGGANRSWSDADLDDVGTSQQQLLHHLASHHITYMSQQMDEMFKNLHY